MLPTAYSLPVAVLLVLGGTIACFAGYRLLRIVLGIYGFILGAMLASSFMGITNTVGQIAAAVVGGLVGSLLLVFAYFIGVALVGAGLGALFAHLIWQHGMGGDPPAIAVISASVVGAAGAMILQRFVIIAATAFAGSWTVIVGGLAIAATQGVAGLPAPSDPWILYPFSPASGEQWVIVSWLALGLVGSIVQLAITGAGRGARRKR